MKPTIQYRQVAGDAGLLEARLPFSRVTQIGQLLFVSGQASIENGVIVPGTFEEEFRRTITNLRLTLEGVGSDLTQIAQVRAYVREEADLPLYNTLYRE